MFLDVFFFRNPTPSPRCTLSPSLPLCAGFLLFVKMYRQTHEINKKTLNRLRKRFTHSSDEIQQPKNIVTQTIKEKVYQLHSEKYMSIDVLQELKYLKVFFYVCFLFMTVNHVGMCSNRILIWR